MTPAVVQEFQDFLKAEKIAYDAKEFESSRPEIEAEILEETLRQIYGEGEARRRLYSQDIQLKKAIDSIGATKLLLKDPQRYISETATKRAAK